MFGILVKVKAKPGKRQELIDFLKWDGEVAREKEPGTLRFEFYQDPADENGFYVYEAYRDLEAFEEHKKNEPYKAWHSGLQAKFGDKLENVFSDDAVWSPTD